MPVRRNGKEQLGSLSFETAFGGSWQLGINEVNLALLMKPTLTFKQRTDPPPARDAALARELPQSRFQEEDRDSTADEKYHVRNQECPCEGAEG